MKIDGFMCNKSLFEVQCKRLHLFESDHDIILKALVNFTKI